MRTIENFALVPSPEEESIKEKISKEQISKIMDDVFVENDKINNIIKNLGDRINQLKIPKLGFNSIQITPPASADISKMVASDIEQIGFGNFWDIGRVSNIRDTTIIGKFNFFYFNGEADINVNFNANIKNESVYIYDDATVLDYKYLLKKFADKKLNVLKLEDNKVGSIKIDVPRTCNVLFLSNIVSSAKARTESETSSLHKNTINVSGPILIITHNCIFLNLNIKYWAENNYQNTECPQLQCPKIVCPKFECPKVECPKVECPNYNKIYIGVIISLLLAMFILTYLYLTKKETN